MPMATMLYAGLLGLMAIAVAFPAGSLRGKLNIPIGDGGHTELIRAMRRQANFMGAAGTGADRPASSLGHASTRQ